MGSCGDCHSAALSEDGTVYAWGTYKDSKGYIGFSEGSKFRETPGVVEGLPKIAAISSGAHHTGAVTRDGRLFLWGDAEQGQIGRKVPVRLKKKGLRVHPVVFPRVSATSDGSGRARKRRGIEDK